MTMDSEDEFWIYLEQVVENNRIVIDRPKGTPHPQYPDFIYPLDYGYLEETQTSDADGIDVWVGSSKSLRLDGVLCTVDLKRNDVEVKVLLGCSADDIRRILEVTNSNTMRAILISRDDS
jgi:inorganic pyrophosphatase